MFYMKVINQGWYCDDCGYIDDFSVICKFNNIIIKEEYDGHFGSGGKLGYNYDDIESFKILIDPFLNEFKNIGIEILDIKEEEIFLTDFDYQDTVIIIDIKTNDNKKTFKFISSPVHYEKNPDKDKNLYQEFFKFIGIDFTLDHEDENQINETDWLY